jgi:hypothetical protein
MKRKPMPSIANMVRSAGDPKILESGPSSVYPEDRMAKSLGWFSVGLGIAEIIAARRFTRLMGLEGMESVVRAFGAREIASGMTTLSTEKETGLWSRLAGDALDLAVLARGMTPYNPQRGNVKWAMLTVAGVTALDLLTASAVTARKRRASTPASYADRIGFPKGLKPARRQQVTAARKSSGARM